MDSELRVSRHRMSKTTWAAMVEGSCAHMAACNFKFKLNLNFGMYTILLTSTCDRIA
jgi:hypothetical protein